MNKPKLFSWLLILTTPLSGYGLESKTEITPHLDFYYLYSSNEPFPPNAPSSATVSSASQPLGNVRLRSNDEFHNQFSLSLLELSIKHQRDTMIFLADLDFGHTADRNARLGSGPQRLTDESTKHIGQAWLLWEAPDFEGLYVKAGKVKSHMSRESWKAWENDNYSLSLLSSFGLPTWHTGVQVGRVWNQNFSSMVAIYNGWNNYYDTNAAKTLGLQLIWSDANQWATRYNFIGGAEQNNESMNQRHVHSMEITWRESPCFHITAMGALGFEENVIVSGNKRDLVTWSSWSLMSSWGINEWTSVAPRFEWYNDDHGATIGFGEQRIWSAALTQSYFANEDFEPRAEIRYDKASSPGLFSRAGAAVDDQLTITLSILFSPNSF